MLHLARQASTVAHRCQRPKPSESQLCFNGGQQGFTSKPSRDWLSGYKNKGNDGKVDTVLKYFIVVLPWVGWEVPKINSKYFNGSHYTLRQKKGKIDQPLLIKVKTDHSRDAKINKTPWFYNKHIQAFLRTENPWGWGVWANSFRASLVVRMTDVI